ncbi:MAG TPA: choice-of-anchor tandem repeat GloVer-containing protein [Terriglobales bacterium]|nr:choice-of-anchor tandem repeat GloVer-containing protein [Terriglobales bacterium]
MKHPVSSIPVAGLLTALIVVPLLTGSAFAAGPKEKVLYEFQGQVGQSGVDAAWPTGGVIADAAGNFYGTTFSGGSQPCYVGSDTVYPCGTVFQITPPATKGGAWTETILHNFSTGTSHDGFNPLGGLVSDAKGNLYGTTSLGGNVTNNQLCVGDGVLIGCGTVFELTPPAQKGGDWKETILYNFQGGQIHFFDGAEPFAGVTLDSQGNLYGTTRRGGDTDGYSGIAYRLSPPAKKGGHWKEEILYNFSAATSGAEPYSGVILGKKGNLYGTTRLGAGFSGAVYKLSPPTKRGGAWSETTLHAFASSDDGAYPIANLVFDDNGNLYGTTEWGGGQGCTQNSGCGIVFKLSPSAKGPWKETILYRFQGGTDGLAPGSNLVFDPMGNLYGTTQGGGNENNCTLTLYPFEGCGTIFQLSPQGEQWKETILHVFQGYASQDGAVPLGGLSLLGKRKLYGTTASNGYSDLCNSVSGQMNPFPCGTVFELSLPKAQH